MKKQFIPYSEVPGFAKIDRDFISRKPELDIFLSHPINKIEDFKSLIDQRSNFGESNRQKLVNALLEQWNEIKDDSILDLEISSKVVSQIQFLSSSKTFTVTTAHQPVIFSGPLYIIYKIASTIHLANSLNQKFPENNIIPVFVVGSEDHDFEEISTIQVFGKKVIWENENIGGPAGRMQSEELEKSLNEILTLLGDSENAIKVKKLLEESYKTPYTLSQSTRKFLYSLFGKYGLVIIDMDHPDLKKNIIPIFESEIKDQITYPLVLKNIKLKEELGYASQATPREINLFYFHEGKRNRIVFENDVYSVLQTNLKFSLNEILQELYTNPKNFSPNVVLRPVYQEVILPNLAYIGGGGEISYWMERKLVFEALGIPMPALIRRNSVLLIENSTQQKISKINLSLDLYFLEIDNLIQVYLNSKKESNWLLQEEKLEVQLIFAKIAEKIKTIDITLEKAALAELTNTSNAIEKLESKMVKSQKNKEEVQINQMRNIKEKLFPGNQLQERIENVLPFISKFGLEFIPYLIENLNPLNSDFLIIEE
jgi:bacillithiol synthase